VPDPVRHPAPYSHGVLVAMRRLLADEAARCHTSPASLRILDPMAGIGRVHQLPGKTVGVELEPEWADQHPKTKLGDATCLPFRRSTRFDVICVSPAYGNRFADHHEAKDGSERRSYTHDLGRQLSPGSTCNLHWGPKYRELHERIWTEVTRFLKPEGLFILNVSDFIAKRERVPVAEWHLCCLFNMGYHVESIETVATKRMRKGENHAARVDGELIAALRRKP
jgi:hypothetical protein